MKDMVMNFKTASDFELNKRLAELLGLKVLTEDPTPNKQLLVVAGYDWCGVIDYCNSWADMGPVIEDIWDDLVWCTDYEEVYWEEVIREYECSKLRAAVIVAIQVLEQRAEEI